MHSYIEVPGFGAKWSILKKYNPTIKGYRELGAKLGYSDKSPNTVRLWVIEDKIPVTKLREFLTLFNLSIDDLRLPADEFMTFEQRVSEKFYQQF